MVTAIKSLNNLYFVIDYNNYNLRSVVVVVVVFGTLTQKGPVCQSQ